MKNKEMKKTRLVRMSIENPNRVEKILQLDDSITDDDISCYDSGSMDGFEHFLINELYDEELYPENYVDIYEFNDHDREVVLRSSEPDRFIYKDESGCFSDGHFLVDGIESVLYFTGVEVGTCLVYLSSPFKKTKELWNKGKIEELKSYHVPYQHLPEPNRKQDVEVLQKIYDSRNGWVGIRLEDRDSYMKNEGIQEHLVDKELIPITVKMEEVVTGETSLYVTKEVHSKLKEEDFDMNWSHLFSNSIIQSEVEGVKRISGTVERNFHSPTSIKKILTEDGDLISL